MREKSLDKDYFVINSDDRQLKTMSPGITKEEVEAAKKVVTSLLLANKKFSLYPEGHITIMNATEQLYKQIEIYLLNYGDLRLDIEKDKLLSQGEVIYSGPPEEGSLPFTLFRDGIRWLEFSDGIDVGELKEFLRIINKYSTLSDEPEGDIVTDFWEMQLPHMKYEVADFFWGADQEVELTPYPDTGDKGSVLLRENKLKDWEPLPDPAIDRASIVLTPQENEILKEMVRVEEEADPTAYLDALLDSLLQNRERENFDIIFEVLKEEFKNSLVRRDFDISLKILQSLQYVLDTCTSEIPWAVPLIEDFILTVSSSQALKPLQEVWSDIDSEQIEKIRQILQLLQPEAIPTLGTILLQNQSVKQRQILVEAIISLASRDFSPLESLLKNPDEKLMERLIHVFVKLEGERSSKVLMKMVRHPSTHVRQEAVKGLLKRGHARIKDIFNLIDDKDESIRRLVLKQMGQSRDQVVERLLLDYLEHRKFNGDDREHVIACFITLGQCGSSRSIPFLRRTLFGRRWLPDFGMSAHREGAAIGLSKMRTKEAQQVLEDASRSLFPSVRHIVQKVKKELK
jgi:HEAT repeat protein